MESDPQLWSDHGQTGSWARLQPQRALVLADALLGPQGCRETRRFKTGENRA
jgi:hypothetical protein